MLRGTTGSIEGSLPPAASPPPPTEGSMPPPSAAATPPSSPSSASQSFSRRERMRSACHVAPREVGGEEGMPRGAKGVGW